MEAHQFVPLGGQSALAVRTLGIFGYGPDAQTLPGGGLGLVRGYQKHLLARAGTSVAVANAELRFPIVQNLDYYMWFIFPDLYFKAVYGTLCDGTGAGKVGRPRETPASSSRSSPTPQLR